MTSSHRQRIGKHGEYVAVRHLRSSGYSVLETNYRAKGGEIDVVAEKNGTLVFVEVRARTSAILGSPEESLTLPSART